MAVIFRIPDALSLQGALSLHSDEGTGMGHMGQNDPALYFLHGLKPKHDH